MLAEKNIDGSLSNDLTLNMFIQKAQRFCVFQERSIYQTEQKLRTWGANEKTISKVLEHLKDNDFLNQNRFIESFVSGKLKYNKWGKIKIIVELRAHQITDELINEYIGKIDDDIYRQILFDLIDKKNNTLTSENNLQVKKQKIINYCLSKGFEFEGVNKIVKSLK